ncbi:4'-phosphopantetheinyl transferase family protein [Derxia gummosa]|uniref:4'-phosphopantetheinyl transferase family protein n=1 Tax=Derxia gummosa DSM 723 TaxID=1121388 RepID=A0A8B6XCJ3_9BURK|nr:4'-phosphopantetheinyl transferase superfamily protein [Derxia gummosa]
MAELLGVDARRVRLGRAASGAPIARVPGRGRVWLSASDTRGGYAVAASVAGPVGIDIERPRGRRVAADQPWLHPREQAAIAGVGAARREAVFLGIWTQKEAVLKLDGGGLGAGLAGFAVEVDPARPAGCDAAARPRLRRLAVAGLAGALASRSRRPAVVDAVRLGWPEAMRAGITAPARRPVPRWAP